MLSKEPEKQNFLKWCRKTKMTNKMALKGLFGEYADEIDLICGSMVFKLEKSIWEKPKTTDGTMTENLQPLS